MCNHPIQERRPCSHVELLSNTASSSFNPVIQKGNIVTGMCVFNVCSMARGAYTRPNGKQQTQSFMGLLTSCMYCQFRFGFKDTGWGLDPPSIPIAPVSMGLKLSPAVLSSTEGTLGWAGYRLGPPGSYRLVWKTDEAMWRGPRAFEPPVGMPSRGTGGLGLDHS